MMLNQPRFDARALLDTLVERKVTSFFAPPTVWRMLLQEDLRAWPVVLREVVAAGEPLNPEVIDQVRRAWGLRAFFGPSALVPNNVGMSLHTSAELRKLAEHAGFKDIRIRFEHRTARYPAVAEFLTGWTRGSPNAGQFLAFPDEMRDRFIAYLTERLESFVDDDGIAIPRENHFLVAAR
jgi:acyl-CoA synthetase (AMP-forming)/AMP-acid ligase II